MRYIFTLKLAILLSFRGRLPGALLALALLAGTSNIAWTHDKSLAPSSYDVGISGLVSPGLYCYGSSETITVQLNNYGTDPIDFSVDSVIVTVNVTGTNAQSFTSILKTGSLAAGASMPVTVTTGYNMSAPGTYTFNSSAAIVNDINTANNAMPAATRKSLAASPIPQTVTFNGYTGANLTTLFPGWYEAGGTTPAGTTSAWTSQTNLALTGNRTARINIAAATRNEWIISPKFLAATNTQLRFKAAVTAPGSVSYSSFMGSDDKVSVMLSTDCGNTWFPATVLDKNTQLNSRLRTFTIDLSSYAGQYLLVGFYATNGPVADPEAYDLHIDDINITNDTGIDLGITGLASPTTGCYTANETIAVTLKNFSAYPVDLSINNATINVNITGTNPQTFSLIVTSGVIAPGATMPVTLSTAYNMSAVGPYTFTASSTISGDFDVTNDAIYPVTLYSNATAAVPLTMNFNGYTGANLTTVYPAWREAFGQVPSGTASSWTSRTGIGSSSNVSAKVNLFTNNRQEWIISPKFLAAANTTLRFNAAITGLGNTNPAQMGSDDSVRVLVSNNCGATWTPLIVFTRSGNAARTFSQYGAYLGAYAGQEIMIAFYATDGPADDPESYDFIIDDINIENLNGIDAGPVGMITPVSQSCLSSSETVTAAIKNHGYTPIDLSINNITVNVSVTGPNPGSFMTTISSGTIPAGGTLNVVMPGTLDMSAAGLYTFNISTSVSTADYDAGNDNITVIVRSVSPSAAAIADFAICDGQTATLASTALASGPAPGTVKFATTTDVPTIDLDTISSKITVTSPLLASDLHSVIIDSLYHPYISDLDIFLVAPNGSRIELSTANGTNGDNYMGTRFIPTATTTIFEGMAPFTGDFTPEEPFSKLTGNAAGDWELLVIDNVTNDQGTLKGWTIVMKEVNQIVSYSWSPSADLSSSSTAVTTAAPTATTTYTVTATDANGCTAIDSVKVTVNPKPEMSVTGDDVNCNGDDDGSAAATVTGGTPAYSYAWINGQTTAAASSLVAGTYSVIVTDNAQCSDTASVVISEPSVLVLALTSTPSCTPGSNGAASVSASGGTPGYSYLWRSGQTGSSISGLPAGTYTIDVTDANGCLAVDSIDIAPIFPPVITLSNDTTICYGDSAALTASGGDFYAWSTGGSGQTETVSPLMITTYTVTVTGSNGCSTTDDVTVDVNPLPAAGFTHTDSANAVSFTNLSANAVSYQWTFGDGTTDTVPDPLHTYTQDGIYTVTLVAANDCGSDTITGTVSVITTGIEKNVFNTIYILPNPSEGRFTIHAPGLTAGLLSIDVLDMQGRIIMSDTAENTASALVKEIDLSNAAKGIYYIRLSSGSNVTTRRIAIQ